MNKIPPDKTRLACPECGQISARIFEVFLLSNVFNPPAYILLDWVGCQNKQCRNWFQELKNISRCPVCKLWIINFNLGVENPEDKIWQCKNKNCGWNFKITATD